MTKSVSARKRAHERWRKKARAGEVLGGGYFVAQRESRARFSMRPFEHGTMAEAYQEAARLAGDNPGVTYEVYALATTFRVEPAAVEPSAAAAE